MTLPQPAQLRALMDAAASAPDDVTAEPLLRQIVGLNARDAAAWHMLAAIAIRSGRPEDAIASATNAVRLERDNPMFLSALGVAQAEAGNLDEALRCFKRCLKARPDFAEGHYNLGKLYGKLGDLAEAERSYLRARRLDPARNDVLNNLALLYCAQARYDTAQSLFAEARARAPHDEQLTVNAALPLHASEGPAAAIALLRDFVSAHPAAAAARADLGRRLLAEGHYREGWREYAWRHGQRAPLIPPQARRVLLLPAQGLGDQLFFLRFAAALRARVDHVGYACPDKLRELLQSISPVDELCSPGGAKGFDLELALDQLPAALGEEAVPEPLRVQLEPARVEGWRARLRSLGPSPYLAVTWRAGGVQEERREFARRGEQPLYKEVKLADLASALRHFPGTVLAIQRNPAPGECDAFARALGRHANDVSAANEDLVEMAALLSVVDEYVGVSNTNMHLRAAVSKTARVLVPFPPEFRWMHEGREVPWFPGFATYRQGTNYSWDAALEPLRLDLSL